MPLSAARGHLDEAVTQLHAAAHGCQFLPMPFEVARTHVVIGQIHRRRREKCAAADALQLALDGFEKLGATSWAERTRAELSRVGLRPAAPLALTETERRVAELVATGRTSRDVASALFLVPRPSRPTFPARTRSSASAPGPSSVPSCAKGPPVRA